MNSANDNLFNNVDCVHLKVDNLDNGISFYCSSLGLKLLWRTEHACGLGCQNDITEVVLNDDMDLTFDIKVDDVLKAIPKFEKAGGTIEYGPFEVDIGKCVLVKDMWGNRYCLLDMSKGTYDTDEFGKAIGVSKKDGKD